MRSTSSRALSAAARARAAGLAGFEITGFVSDAQFRDYVTAVDLGVQLRVSPLLGVSGPLSDMAAVGTPAVASRGLAIDVDTPAFIDRLAHPADREVIEAQRVDYLERKSPKVYAEELLAVLPSSAWTELPLLAVRGMSR